MALTFGNKFPRNDKYDRDLYSGAERCGVCNKILNADAEFLIVHSDESENIITEEQANAAWANGVVATQYLVGSTCIKKFAPEVINA